tara:strand:- start:329 stop:616 length:288 start_codon:yes stop_codon:yes gene_type:complete
MGQGYNARLDDSLGAKHGSKSQSEKARRDESEGMEKSMHRRKFSGNKSSAQGSMTPSEHGAHKVLKHMAHHRMSNELRYMPVVDREKDSMKKGDM